MTTNTNTVEQAAQLTAEAALLAVQARREELEISIKEIDLRAKTESEQIKTKGDFRSGHFTFCDGVSSSSVDYLLTNLRRFSRLNPKAPITIEIQSPGGSIIDGFRLYDEIVRIKREGGHFVTFIARGHIASMAVPIFQAADHRIIGPSCFVMIHRAAFGAVGKAYDIEDQVEFVQRLEARIVDILVERGTKDRQFYADLFSQRRDAWYSAAEAIELGLGDEVA